MKQKIKISIQAFQKSGDSEAALRLLQTLDYNTSRENPFSQKTYSYFKESFLDGDNRFNEDRGLVKEWRYVDLLFQLSSHPWPDSKMG